MKHLTLTRFYTDECSTLGCLTCLELTIAIFTCELPWNNNQPWISCIPSGQYKLIPHNSPKFGKCLKVLNVPNRGDILIHKGNSSRRFVDMKGYIWQQDTTGCILPGMSCRYDGIVQNSQDAFHILIELILDEWDLEIINIT